MTIRIALLLSLLLLAGCPSASEPPAPLERAEPVGPLRLLVVDDPPLADAIEREWSARTGEAMEVRQITQQELLGHSPWKADAVIYPPGLMGELVSNGRIVPIPAQVVESDSFDRRTLLPLVRQYEMRWGDETYGIPLAAPRLALLYRSDLFERLDLQPPATWREYQQLAARLSQRAALGELAPDDDRPWSGTVEPLAAGWRGQLLLARAASVIARQGHLSTLFEFSTMKPLLDSPPFVDALSGMQAAAASGPDDRLEIDPAEARRRLLAGETAMAITWLPTPHDPDQPRSAAAEAPPLGVAPLPGSAEFYSPAEQAMQPRKTGVTSVVLLSIDGRMGSVTQESARRGDAFDLLMLLAGAEWSVDVARRSTAAHPFRRQHLAQLQGWLPAEVSIDTSARYAEYLDDLEQSQPVLISPRIPGRLQYLAALDAAVEQVIAEGADPQSAARDAATAWQAITQQWGVENQRTAFRLSAGIGL